MQTDEYITLHRTTPTHTLPETAQRLQVARNSDRVSPNLAHHLPLPMDGLTRKLVQEVPIKDTAR
jgi:hypothetical protein